MERSLFMYIRGNVDENQLLSSTQVELDVVLYIFLDYYYDEVKNNKLFIVICQMSAFGIYYNI